MELIRKLEILADAAKYDASCASSGSDRPRVPGQGGAGICHSYAPDGRCISLLKILLSNYCSHDCLYCVNRVSSNVPRARFAIDEVVQLTLDFHRRNVIDGLFLSSGIVGSADATMEQMVEVARRLREVHGFTGYIHLKTIPAASDALLAAAGRHADRLSINIELPTPAGLAALAPAKDDGAIRRTMARLRTHIDDARGEARDAHKARPPRFAPGGQSTQMIVGADASDDRTILEASARLYAGYRLKRVYYSAFSPIPDAPQALPSKAPPLMREHRLYQADWLTRFYGFGHDEIVVGDTGMLSLELDPKLAWALAHPERFPVDLNRAPRELLLRVPGLGVKSVGRLLASRRWRRLRATDLASLKLPLRKVLPFVVLVDHMPGRTLELPGLAARLRDEGAVTTPLQTAPSQTARLQAAPRQASLFPA